MKVLTAIMIATGLLYLGAMLWVSSEREGKPAAPVMIGVE